MGLLSDVIATNKGMMINKVRNFSVVHRPPTKYFSLGEGRYVLDKVNLFDSSSDHREISRILKKTAFPTSNPDQVINLCSGINTGTCIYWDKTILQTVLAILNENAIHRLHVLLSWAGREKRHPCTIQLLLTSCYTCISII